MMSASSEARRCAFLLVIWSALWAGSFAATKFALKDSGPNALVAVRCLLAGSCLCALRWRHIPARRSLASIGALGLSTNGAYLTLMAYALPGVPSGYAALLSATTPILVLSLTALRGQSGRRVYLGAIVALAGIALSSTTRLRTGDASLESILTAAGAVGFLAAGTYLTPSIVRQNVDLTFAAGWQALAGGLPIAIVAFLTGELTKLRMAVSLLAAVSYLVLLGSCLGLAIWQYLVHRMGAAKASLGHFLTPLWGMLLGSLLLGESVGWLSLLAALPVALGVILATTSGSGETSDDSETGEKISPRIC